MPVTTRWCIAAIAALVGLAFLLVQIGRHEDSARELVAITPGAETDIHSERSAQNAARVEPAPQRSAIESTDDAHREATLRLAFRLPDGTPVTGGTVTLGQGTERAYVTTPVHLDLDGRWQGTAWDGVDFIEWSATVQGSDRWHGFASGRKILEPPFDPQGEDRSIDIEVELGHVLTGTVVDRTTGLALSHVFVALPEIVSGRSLGTHTGTDGRFRLAGIDAATFPFDAPFEVTATHPEYPPAKHAIDWSALPPTIDVVIAMDRGVVVHGTITDASGTPRGGVTIELAIGAGTRDEPRPYVALVGARTDEGGRFVFPALARGAVAELRYGPLEQTYVEEIRERAVVEVQLTVELAETVRLRALDPLGTPLTDFSFYVRGPDGRMLWQPARRSEFDARAGDAVDIVVFAEGASRTQWLRGEQHVVVAPGRNWVEVRTAPVHVEPTTRDDVSMSWTQHNGVRNRLNVWAFGSTFVIDVRRDDGTPYVGRYRIDYPSGSRSTSELADGRFWLSLPPGRHRMLFTTDGFAARVLEVESAESGFVPIRIDLHR